MKQKNILKTIQISLCLFAYCLQMEAQEKAESASGITSREYQEPQYIIFDNKTVRTENALEELKSNLQITEEEDFVLFRSGYDTQKDFHQRYQQYYKGYPVENGVYIIHSKEGKVSAVNGRYIDVKGKAELSNNYTKETALSAATEYIIRKNNESDNNNITNIPVYTPAETELWITEKQMPDGKMGHILVYKFDFSAYEVIVEAGTGIISGSLKKMKYLKVTADKNGSSNTDKTSAMVFDGTNEKATITTRYSGVQIVDNFKDPLGKYSLRDQTRTDHAISVGSDEFAWYEFYKTDNNVWQYPAEFGSEDARLDVFWGLQKSYDYFLNILSRKGLNNPIIGKGIAITALVHHSTNWDNAAWKGGSFLFGDGYKDDAMPQNNQLLPVTTLDITAHEYAHAVSEHEAALDGSIENESGALSEGFSDIFGACVDNYINMSGLLLPQYKKNPWLDGAEIKPEGYRDLADPESNGQPSTYLTSPNWTTVPEKFSHRNSTIISHWFYLISMGGTGTNHNNDTYNVEPIGIDKAQQIAYKMLFYLQGSFEGFKSARLAAIQATKDIYGSNNELKQVIQAWYAVGVGNPYCLPEVSTSAKYITKADLNGTVSNTGSGTYSYYTSVPIKAVIGSNATFAAASESSTSKYWKVWIDLNRNQSFNDPGEMVLSFNGASTIANFAIPVSTGKGKTVMRIMMSTTTMVDACSNLSSGEIEDYQIEIVEPVCISADNYEPNNTKTTARSIAANTFSGSSLTKTVTLTGYICYKDPKIGADEDWFTFTNKSRAGAISPIGNHTDVLVELVDAPMNYKVKLFNSSSNTPIGVYGNSDKSTEFHPCYGATDTYYIKVYGQDGAFDLTKSYKLKITLTAISHPCSYMDMFSKQNMEISNTEMTVFPNPGKGRFTLNYPEKVAIISVIDLTGKILLEKQVNGILDNYEIDITAFPSGNYIIKTTGEKGSVSKIVIKE